MPGRVLTADAYLKGVAAVVTVVVALVVLMARERRGAVPLAVFLGLIALNQTMETARAIVDSDAERLTLFRAASVAASLDPFAFAWFAASVLPRVARHRMETIAVGALGGALALYAGWGLDEIPGVDPRSHGYTLALSAYTTIVYLVVLYRAAGAAGSEGRAVLGALVVGALPAAPRPIEEIHVYVEPALRAARPALGGYLPLILVLAVYLAALVVALRRRLAPETARALQPAILVAIALLVLARIPQVAADMATRLGSGPVDVYILGRSETPVRWLIFGALGSVAVFGSELLAVPLDVRRRAARLLVAVAFLAAGAGALAIATVGLGDRPVDAIFIVVLLVAVAISQGFGRFVDLVAARLYGVPIRSDTASAEAIYRRAVADVLARGGAPARDPGLERTRRSLGIDRATASAIESLVEEVASAPVAPGRLVGGRYHVERALGGNAYLATDLRIERRVELREIRASDPGERDVALREARIVGALAHPNVLVVHDALPRAGGWIVVTEHVEGQTLADALARHALDQGQRRAVAEALVDALAAIHARGIAHGRVRAQSVILAAHGAPKLADFGVGQGATIPGDVYALGHLLREVLGPGNDPGGAIARALREDPAARWASAVEMRDALQT